MLANRSSGFFASARASTRSTALGSTFGPSLVHAFGPEGDISDRQRFLDVLHGSRTGKGLPSALEMGLDSTYFEGIYRYLTGRGTGKLKGGRPARLETVSGT